MLRIRDDRGQIMILTAVVLIIAFVALAAMVGRLGQLTSETVRESDSPIRQEIRRVDAVLEEVVSTAEDDLPANLDLQVEESLQQLQRLEAARGYLFSWEFVCDGVGTGYVQVYVSDDLTRVGLASPSYARPSC